MRPKILGESCRWCGKASNTFDFAPARSVFIPSGLIPICNECIRQYLEDHDFNWENIDKICQFADIPFVPSEWERLKETHGADTFPIYANIFRDDEYKGIGWSDYFKQFQELRAHGELEEELPELREAKTKQLQEIWGANYDYEALQYLEDFYQGLLQTQNVNGALQLDQARKICKVSYEIECKVRAGEDFDKLLASYEKIIKAAEFTPKNAKNANDFDSFAEICYWLEKRGHMNRFYDDVTRDVIDETLKNIENYNQRLYLNEGGIGDAITERLQALKAANDVEDNNTNDYDLPQEFDEDAYDNAGFANLDEAFEVETDND